MVGAASKFTDLSLRFEQFSSVSPFVLELVRVLGNPETCREKIIDLVKQDEVVYSNVFKHVKTVAFGLQRYPNSIEDAVNTLGQYGLRDLVFSVTSRSLFSDTELWKKSLFVAMVAKDISEKSGYGAAESSNIYIASMMHFVGELLIKTFYKDQYLELTENTLNHITDYQWFKEEEKKLFDISFSELSYKIAFDCNLPKDIIELLDKQSLDINDEGFIHANAIIFFAKALYEFECLDIADIETMIGFDFLKHHRLDTLDIGTRVLNNYYRNIKSIIGSEI